MSASMFVLLGMVGLGQVATSFAEAPEKSAVIVDLRRTLQPAIEQNRQFMLRSGGPGSYVAAIRASRWRDSIPSAVRALVQSDEADDRQLGWKLAAEYGYRMEWAVADIDRILSEPDHDVKDDAIHSVLRTDPVWSTRLLERILQDPEADEGCLQRCVLQLDKVLPSDDRVRLWLLAAGKGQLRAACLSTFHLVNFNESVIQAVTGWLDDRSTANRWLSDHVAREVEIRVLACEALGTIVIHQAQVVEQIQQRCHTPPVNQDVEFMVAAMAAIDRLDSQSTRPAGVLVSWYDALPEERETILRLLPGNMEQSDRLEAMLIARIPQMREREKCCVCEWLSCRPTPAVKSVLRELLDDSHAGVRVAAAVALCTVDPLYDLGATRESILATAVAHPDQVALHSLSVDQSVLALARAGQSDQEALKWLGQNRAADLEAVCATARDLLQTASPTP